MFSRRYTQKWFKISSFQQQGMGDLFVGYKSSTRLNELEKLYPNLFAYSNEGRFKLWKIRWKHFDEFWEDFDPSLKFLLRRQLPE